MENNKSGGLKVPFCPPGIIAERCKKLAVDIVGPLPTSLHDYIFIVTAMKLASGFPYALPLKSYTAQSTAQALLFVTLVGPPIVFLSDQGTNFMFKV